VAAFERLADEFNETVERGAGDPQRDGLSRLDGVFESVFRRPHLDIDRLRAWFGFWHSAPLDPELRKVNESVSDRHVAVVTDLVAQTARERGLSVDAERVGNGLAMLMDGAFLALAGASSSVKPRQAEDICKHFARMVLGLEELAVDVTVRRP
jgi:BetI-type transcriptional repressor, C-terminal